MGFGRGLGGAGLVIFGGYVYKSGFSQSIWDAINMSISSCLGLGSGTKLVFSVFLARSWVAKCPCIDSFRLCARSLSSSGE